MVALCETPIVVDRCVRAEVCKYAVTTFGTIQQECVNLSDADTKATCLNAWAVVVKARISHDVARVHLVDRKGAIALAEAEHCAKRNAAKSSTAGRFSIEDLKTEDDKIKGKAAEFVRDVEELQATVDSVVTPIELDIYATAGRLGCITELNLEAACEERSKRVATEVKNIVDSLIMATPP